MKTNTYKELIDSQVEYFSTLERLEIRPKHTRWDIAYGLIRDLETARVQGKMDEINPKVMGRMRFALTDIYNLMTILEQFKDDKSILFKKKFVEILRGSDSQIDETADTNKARNTQFELMMCARFKEVGLDSVLCNSNPDILVRVNGRKYGFECKRVFSQSGKSIESNARSAILQLNESFLDDDFTKRGLPLIGIDRHISGGDQLLEAKNEDNSRSRLGHEIENFIEDHRRHWVGASKVKQERILGVLVYINMTTLLREEGIQVVSHQFGVNNSGWTLYGTQLFQEFLDDIVALLGPVSKPPA
jgi:hypothetical protein